MQCFVAGQHAEHAYRGLAHLPEDKAGATTLFVGHHLSSKIGVLFWQVASIQDSCSGRSGKLHQVSSRRSTEVCCIPEVISELCTMVAGSEALRRRRSAA